MGFRHGRHCGCQQCKTIVYPTKHNCVNNFSESTVNHVHPSHTTVMNHHQVKNKHFYPHSTSVQNTTNSVNEFGGAFNVPAQPNQVGGAMSPGPGMGQGGQVGGAMSPGHGMGHGGQVGGAMSPGADCGQSGQVGGAMSPGHGHGQGGHWNKHGKWC